MGLSLLRGSREEKSHSCRPISCRLCRKSAAHTAATASDAGITGSPGRTKMRIADVLQVPDDSNDDSPCSATVKGRRKKGRRRHAFAESAYSSSPCKGSPLWALSKWLALVQKTGTLPAGRRDSGCLVGFRRWKDAEVEQKSEKVEKEQEEVVVEERAGSPSSSSSTAAVREAENDACSTSGGEEVSVSESKVCPTLEREEVSVSVPKEAPSSGTLSERPPEKESFKLGLEAALVFLLARNSNEYKKTLELRKEMDMILQEIKNSTQDKNALSKSMESERDTKVGVSDSCGGAENPGNYCPLLQDDRLSFGMIEPELPCGQQEDFPDCHEHLGNGSSDVDQLEKEIQNELDVLQLRLEEEELLEPYGYQPQLVDENRTSQSYSAGSEEFDHQEIEEDDDISCQNGVCPIKLERKLHELLHARQQERIDELESALRAVEAKLQEKETEISWWRDTVRLVSSGNRENPAI